MNDFGLGIWDCGLKEKFGGEVVKIAGLVIGILGMILGFVVLVICLMLPSMTNNRINFEESLVGIIPAVFVGFIAFIITAISAITIMKAKK